MKTFKEFISESPSYNKLKITRKTWNNSPLFFDSSFRETCDKNLKESFNNFISSNQKSNYKTNHHGVEYSSNIHDDSDVAPKELSDEHKDAIQHYCTAHFSERNGHSSSRNMNSYLRNKSGDKSQSILGRHSEESVKRAIEKLSSVFRPENTNRKEMTTWGGVPSHIGEHLINSGKGSEHHIPGFTSTTATPGIAHLFASRYINDANDDRHIIQYHIKPGAGLSAAHHSSYPEDEVILHHGARIKYSHTTTYNHDGDTENSPHKVHVHHVTVFPDHKPLSEYGKYDKQSLLKKFFKK